MASNNKSISVAEILCTLAFIAASFLMVLGWNYEGESLPMSVILTLVVDVLLLVLLCGAVKLKKSKPFHKTLWRVLEWMLIVLYVCLALVAMLPVLSKFVYTEWTGSQTIATALEEDHERVNTLFNDFKAACEQKLNTTKRGLVNLQNAGYAGKHNLANSVVRNFIKEHLNGGGDEHLDNSNIRAYYEGETAAIASLRETVRYFSSYDSYKEAAFFERPTRARELQVAYDSVTSQLQTFAAQHPYPSITRSAEMYKHPNPSITRSVKMYQYRFEAPEVQLEASAFKQALGNAQSFNLAGFFIFLLVNFFILLPYIAAMRPQLIRTLGKSGKDLGGVPLILDD
ncbi:MAG: hypothetical protein MR605_04690 [Bacteroidales bacterium]|nr:hypothetical protein [Bacteroidales bacterium]